MRLTRLAMVFSLSMTFIAGCANQEVNQPLGHDYALASKRVLGMHNGMRDSDFGYDQKALFGQVRQITHTTPFEKEVYHFDKAGRLTHLWYQFNGLDTSTHESYLYAGDRLISIEKQESSGDQEVDSLTYDIHGNLIEVRTSGQAKNKIRQYHYEAASKGRTRVRWIDSDEPTVWQWELDSASGHLVSIRRPAWETLFDCKTHQPENTRSCVRTTIHSNPKPKTQKTLEIEQSNGLPVMEVSLLGEAGSTQTDYTHTYDPAGNWVKRELITSKIHADGTLSPIETRVDMREILYH